jgi:hypothetical protein
VDRFSAPGGASGDLDGQSGLAGTSDRNERDEGAAPQLFLDGQDVLLAPDQRGRGAPPDRERRRPGRGCHRVVAGRGGELTAQQGQVHLRHDRRRVGPEGVRQLGAQGVVAAQRLGLPTGGGERPHEQRREWLVGPPPLDSSP